MKLIIEVDGEASRRIRELAGGPLTQARQRVVREAMISGLQHIIRNNPVDTGRSRAAWVSSLERLGGTPPVGWEGPQPSATGEGRSRGNLVVAESENMSEAAATNSVDYAPFLEYGTSRMAPFAMVRRALLELVGRIGTLFFFGR